MTKSFSRATLLFLWCSTASVHASIDPTFVEPISINDGIWDVLSRVGIVVDEILGVSGCEYFISQVDIPLTITASGNYCLVQSVTFIGTAVTINSSDVVFDMRTYTMNGNSSPNSVGINILADTNVIIQNGMIEGALSAGISSSQFLNDVIIKNVSMIDVGGSSGPSIDFSNGIEGLLVENCYTSNSGAINITGSGVTVRNCYMDSFIIGAGSGGIFLTGISPAYESRYSIIEDCNLTGSGAVDGYGINVSLTQNVIVQNCTVTGLIITGIGFSAVSNVQCLNCYVQIPSTGSYGINITDIGIETTSFLVDSCFVTGPASAAGLAIVSTNAPIMDISVTNCFFSNTEGGAGAYLVALGGSAAIENVTFRNCVFSGNDIGLFLSGGGGFISTVAVEDCVSQGNAVDGYRCANGVGSSVIRDVVFKDCIAQNNASDGFNASGGLCSNFIYEHCFSQSNAGDGFDFGVTTTLIKVRDCLSQNNVGVGYNNLAAVGANIFLANSSFGDTRAFVGVDYVLTKTGATAVSNATYWNNVVF
jgi:hypothetical protein